MMISEETRLTLHEVRQVLLDGRGNFGVNALASHCWNQLVCRVANQGVPKSKTPIRAIGGMNEPRVYEGA